MKDQKGWATGEWNFVLNYGERPIGSYYIKIATKEKEEGYHIEVRSVVKSGDETTEIAGNAGMDKNLGFLRYERTEKQKGKSGETTTVSTAELSGETIQTESKENGKVVEAKEIEVHGEIYAGIPAIIALLKLVDLTKPHLYEFKMFNADGLDIVDVNIEALREKKTLKYGDETVETYQVMVSIGENKMIFSLTENNEIVQFGAPGVPIVFLRQKINQ